LEVEPSGGFVVLVRRGPDTPAPAGFRLDLSIPGEVSLPAAGWTLLAEGPIRRRAGEVGAGAADQVHLDAAELGADLVVRSRRPGDRLRPLGVGGSKKVQDVLVDRKVPRDERDFVPIVTDRRGRIVWVAGHVLAEEFRVSGGTNTVVILKLRRT
jgi:tRNA(Ile)-lysidine synthase